MRKYTFTDTTGDEAVSFENDIIDRLIKSVIKHRIKVGSAISEADTATEVTQHNNARTSEHYSDSPKLINKPKRTMNLAGAKAACGAIIASAAGNVSNNQEIARRWNICRTCPYLTAVSDCMTCGGAGRVSSLINAVKAKFRKNFLIPNEAGKRYCGACGCTMALLLPTLMTGQKVESEGFNQNRPDECWLKKTSPNYKADE